MVKTVRGLISLKELTAHLTDYARKLPEYTRVENDKISITFSPDRIRLELREPTEEVCYICRGSGKDEDGNPCWFCDGTGHRTYSSRLVAYIKENQNYPHYGTIKIQVETEGKNPEVWKPDVEKIRTFIENIVRKRCVIIPTRRTGKPKAIPISDITNQQNLKQFFRGE